MIVFNKKMNEVFNAGSNIRIRDIVKKIIDNTAMIDGCIIYDDDINSMKKKFNIEEMLNAFGHEKIGVEYGCSEQWIDLKDVNRSQIPLFLQWLDFEFSKKYSRRMVFYVTYFKGKYSHIDLRFHSYGEDGELWLAENLDEYKNAIIRYIS